MPAICPYPGLRPFTEEESIFFKGRDLHIRQVVKLLETNKMAFITGASGDGKSSMVYAGVIPFIRAGFFKAQYNSWLIVDFKPQRNPLKSLSDATAAVLGIDAEKCINDLEFGFSSLTDIYKQSGYYVTGVDEAVNKGKNLLIIADQFEEIFTNSENFNDGIPSDASYTAINLLLETIRISVAEQLPVYVIFTMRSDFISQCTVFKHLPEFVAYSQFFVPQLKRDEIRQVIEEPAILAGGGVSPSLTEVIINNLNSGFDQLPVLQHALNLLWKTAQNGKVELDLIHLAKIAGIPKDVLSERDQTIFDAWFATRPEYMQKYFAKPDLNNVLNAHAGMLYESAYNYFQNNADWADKNITPEESKQIIEIAFKSLTKIDNNRQVRNRCTLHEITGIINKPNITESTVCGVLNIFRDEDNTLLRPFIVKDNIETQYLDGDTVLDVTHEALIRNWKLLTQWDREEQSNLNEYNEFNAQVQRWLNNGRKSAFLLPAGNYAVFNDWYQKCRPNKYWILKHDTSQRSEEERLRTATSRMEKLNSYMEQSHNAIVAQEKSKRKKNLYALFILSAFILVLAGFSWWALSEKNNAEYQSSMAADRQRYAEQQQHIAENERQMADLQKKIAQKANEEAQQQRDSVKILYDRARAAKRESDRARHIAEEAVQIAEQERQNAEYNYKQAELQRDTAERERRNALHQRDLTKMANDNAAHLYYVALCNTLAMKAKNQYEDKTLNLRLAKTACDMNLKGGSTTINADLYDAMLYAMEQNNIIKPLNINSSSPIKSFVINPSGQIVTFASNGNIAKYKITGNGKVDNIGSIELNNNGYRVPVESAQFLTSSLIVYSAKDRKSYLIDINTQKRTPLSGANDYVQAVSALSTEKSSDGVKQFAVAYVGGKVAILNINGNEPITQKDFNVNITDIYYHSNNCLYVLFLDGSLKKWNPSTNEIKTVLKSTSPIHAYKMAPITDKHLLAVCYSDGLIQFVGLNTDSKGPKMVAGHSKLEILLYDPLSGFLALSSADKRISLINTNNINEKPLVIEEHSLGNSKVKCMSFNNKGVLFALTDDNKLRFWDTNPQIYANGLSKMNLTLLSDTEWDLIMGHEFSER